MRFVVLEHDHPVLHWDLMLEADGVLQTWRLAAPPERSECAIDAIGLGDHRLAYLDYEGPVSGNRGAVRRWDAGAFDDELGSTPVARKLLLHGERVVGLVHLNQVEGTAWRLTWVKA